MTPVHPETAARELWKRRRAAWWGIAVEQSPSGHPANGPALVVYLRRDPRAHELPRTFLGYPVRHVVTRRAQFGAQT